MDTEQIRALSRHAYGNAYLLEVVACIESWPKERFRPKDISDQIYVASNLVTLVLTKLVRAGLLEKLPKEGQDQPYLRYPAKYWESTAEYVRHLKNPEARAPIL